MNRSSLLALALLTVACSDTTTNPVTQLNLDRPLDVSFACFGGLRLTGGGAASTDQEIIASAQPIEACNIRAGERAVGEPEPAPPGQEDLPGAVVGGANYWAFVLQSGPGTVALARFSPLPPSQFGLSEVRMIDADGLTPGQNGITVGEDPVAIATDRSGCYEVIANKGSCDLSVLEINSIGALQGDSTVNAVVNRMDVRNGAGEVINARPAAMALEPQSGVIGNACPATATGLAYIAYPSCHLVAGVDVSTGTIVTGFQFDANGVPTLIDGTTVTCPSECDGAGVVSAGFRPVALDLEIDPRTSRRLLTIGADNSNVLTSYDLDAAYRPINGQQVALENTTGRLGIISLAISPLIGMGGAAGFINDGFSTAADRQFIYAVTNDGTVRVADVTTVPRECDTQIDPRYLRNVLDVDLLSCLPLGDPDLPRRAGVRGPGIELVGEAQPTSVDIFRADAIAGEGPDRHVGYFAVIAAANGLSFVVNVDDDAAADYVEPNRPIGTQAPLTIAHQLRDDLPSRDLLAQRVTVGTENPRFVCDDPGPDPESSGANRGGARLAGNIARTVPTGTLAAEKFGGLPSIRQVLCDAEAAEEEDRPVSELFFSAPVDVRESVFPDLRALRSDETWTMTWEGSLSLDTVSSSVDGPAVRESQMFVDGLGMRIEDASRPFCEAGVEPYDVVQLRGCEPSLGDGGCPTGYTCYVHPQSQVVGLGACMLIEEAEPLANACRSFLTSLRRYTVGRTLAGEIMLMPRKHVLRTTPTTGCIDNAQCQTLANYAASAASTANPIDDRTPADTRSWACQVDPDRRPELDLAGQPLKRCLLTCETDANCLPGTVCTPNPGAAPAMGYCMEGVTPPQACVNAPQRYELRAGGAFTVIGSRQGFMHPNIADANGQCVRDPDANPLLVGRVPLRAPDCDPAADPRTGRLPDGTFEPNPCMTTVDETEYQLNYVPETCTLANPDESIVTRPATALRLRNRALTLTLVDPTYQGDLRCHGDRDGTLQDVPLITPGYQISFRQTAGFAPQTLGITPSFPIKVTKGPSDSIWVIDQGDFLSTSISQASTRGRVYRVESSSFSVVNLLE